MANIGVINKSYVSALDPLLDTREINNLVTDIQNEDELTDIMNMADRKMPTKQPFYNTYVNETIFKLVQVSSQSGTGTTVVTLVLTAATSGYTRENDTILFVNGNTGIVTSVSTSSGVDTIVVESVSGANLTVANSDQLSNYAMAVGEKSDTPDNLRYGVTRYFNKIQIFRETSKITDIQGASTIEITVGGQNKWTYKDYYDKRIKLKGNINAAIWASDMSVTSFSDSNPILTDPNIIANGGGGGAIQTTRGINKYVELYGTTLVNGTLGTYQKANLDDALDNLTAVRAPKDYLVVGSNKAIGTTDTYYKNLGSAGVTSVRLVVDGKELDMSVEKVSYRGFTLHYSVMPILDHPTLFGTTDITKSLYYLPYNNKVKVYGGGTEAAMRMRYYPKQTIYGNDMIGEIYTGANAPVNPNGSGMFAGCDWITYQGLEVLGAQHLLKQKVIS